MPSSLFNVFGNNNQAGPANTSPFANMSNFLTRFNNFIKTFSGNPEEIVKAKLASGEMSKEQYEDCCNMANQMMGLFGKSN